MNQISLFDERLEPAAPSPPTDPEEAQKEWAFLYTSTEHHSGNNKQTIIRFMMSLDDARAWCESDLSRGTMYGSGWAYFWTSVYNFTHCIWGDKNIMLDPRADNGSFDKKIESLGLRKYGIAEIPGILRPLGVSVSIRGVRERLIEEGLVTAADFAETEKRLKERKKR